LETFVRVVKFCASLAALLVLVVFAPSPSLGEVPAGQSCADPAALALRDANLKVAAGIGYGHSLSELTLYRLMRGVDSEILPDELRDLPWFIDGGPISDWGDDPGSARFQQLLASAQVLTADKAERVKFHYAQLFLLEEGLRSYRPEAYSGDERVDDWWLDEPETSPYRSMEVADWLQSMAASDNLHRVYRGYGRRAYRPLTTSWTYFDPHAFRSQAYDRITRHAWERWRDGEDLVWGLVVYARVLPDDPSFGTLIDRFRELHHKVKACAATRSEYLAYPLMRFHALRLLFSRGVGEPESVRNTAVALMTDGPPIPGSKDAAVSDERIARRVASLYASAREDSWMLSVIAGTSQSSSNAQLQQAFTEDAWMIADTLDRYASLAKDRHPGPWEWWVLNGLSIDALFTLAQSQAFIPEVRLVLARVAWTRAHLLGKSAKAEQIMRFLAAHDATLGALAQKFATAKGPERDHLALLLMLRNKAYSIQAEWPRGGDSRWCGHLTPDSYQGAMDDLLGPVLHYGEVPKLELWWRINYRSELGPPRSFYGGHFTSRVGYTGVLIPREWPDWLETSVDQDELRALARLPSAPELLTRQAIAWARVDQGYFDKWLGRLWPEGDDGPGEALHRAIMTTKRDCRALSHGAYSREAWILLHGNPRWSRWADQTPYWYDRFRNY
jgi:hypothetical protein